MQEARLLSDNDEEIAPEPYRPEPNNDMAMTPRCPVCGQWLYLIAKNGKVYYQCDGCPRKERK